MPDGGTRLHIVPPAWDRSRTTLVLNLSATATIAGGRGPLALPRVRPVGARVADELWMAWTEPGMTLRPSAARGLAWIRSKLLAGSVGGAAVPSGFRESLAWRWIAADAEGRVDRDRVETTPIGTVDLTAMVDPGRLRLNARIVVDAGDEPLRSLVIGATEPSDWTFQDEASSTSRTTRPATSGRWSRPSCGT